ALKHPLRGAFTLTAPHPVTNAEFTKDLAAAVHRPALLPAPASALRLAFGRELADELLLSSTRAVPSGLNANGFTFRHPTLRYFSRAVFRYEVSATLVNFRTDKMPQRKSRILRSCWE